mgnify:CR=1 FL=1
MVKLYIADNQENYFKLIDYLKKVTSKPYYVGDSIHPLSVMQLVLDWVEKSKTEEEPIVICTNNIYVVTTISNCLYAGEVNRLNPNLDVNSILPSKNWLTKDTLLYKAMTNDGLIDGYEKENNEDEVQCIDTSILDRVSSVLNQQFDEIMTMKINFDLEKNTK